jgi:DNA-binding NarL/FixJ family response regulator/PAS domain-containing protein
MSLIAVASDPLADSGGCGHEHLVAFYEAQEFLVETFRTFALAGLRDGQALVVVATAAHRDAFLTALSSEIDMAAIVAEGRYVVLDAAELLVQFMADDGPDQRAFREIVGAVIERTAADGRGVRIYGEMVALLCEAGDFEWAAALEDQWNDLASDHEFALLCAYPTFAFEDAATADAFARIRDLHTTVIPGGAHASKPTLLDRVERAGGTGSWEWTPRSNTLQLSDNLLRLLGLPGGSVPPSFDALKALVHPADLARTTADLEALADDGDTTTFDYRVLGHDHVLRNRRSTVTVSRAEGQDARFTGVVQDTTAETLVARKLAGRAAVSTALDEWRDFERGAGALLAEFAGAMDLCFGVLWVPRGRGLTARVVWHTGCPLLEALAQATRGLLAARAAPTLDETRETGRSVVSNRPVAGASASRMAAMVNAAIHAVLAIPAVAADETLAVLEFFSLQSIEATPDLQRSLDGVGHEVGRFLERRRGQLVAPVLTPREVQVLQLTADAVRAPDIARKMHVSPGTVKRHFENAYAKLGVGDRAGAIAKAMREGLIE